MPNKIILKAVEIDENGNELLSNTLSSKEIRPPTDTSNFGYNQQEQLEIMGKIQQCLLDKQGVFLKSET